MFRPTRSPLGLVPVRLALAVFILFTLLLAVTVVLGMEYERHRLISLGAVSAVEETRLFALRGLAWEDLWKLFAALVAVAAVGIVFFTTFQNARAITHGYERVKSLMRNVLQSIPTGVMTVDARGTITSLNSAAERLFDLRASATVGRSVDEVLQVAPELATWVRAALGGERLVQETDVVVARDEDRRAVRASASELRDESGRADGLVVLFRDISQMNRLELQLRRSDKLAALGTLSAGVAHEVKNPLHAMTLNLHLLEQEVASPTASAKEIDGYFEILRSELQRLHRIVENFLRFSRPSIPETRPLDLNVLLERVVSLVAFEAADHGVAIETTFDPALGTVAGDEGQLSQVFLNLVINALQAMPSGGLLRLSTRAREDWAEVALQDSGEGIGEDVLSHVFDPYFTTRPRGVGLGLAIAHRIVEGHRGTIDVESAVGRGTTMIVRIQLERQAAVPESA